MQTNPTCVRCDAPLPAGRPGDACPQCGTPAGAAAEVPWWVTLAPAAGRVIAVPGPSALTGAPGVVAAPAAPVRRSRVLVHAGLIVGVVCFLGVGAGLLYLCLAENRPAGTARVQDRVAPPPGTKAVPLAAPGAPASAAKATGQAAAKADANAPAPVKAPAAADRPPVK